MKTDPSSFAESFVDDLFALFARFGDRRYGEDVTQLEHALQTAHHATSESCSPALVAASLLHDVGHLLQKLGEDAADRGVDTRHERIGVGYLARAFGPGVTEPIRLHVAAKRYLSSCEPGYLEGLSAASLQSLALQGGPMTADEASVFLADPAAADAIQLRRFDERGKVQGAEPAPLETYRPLLVSLILEPVQQSQRR